ncbi:MAG: siroheme synthase CysG [Wenzhouxiangellaceae bacterium]|nr:siroheme synthase CysG [Wenzhouxiangellaceae bacterium]
MNKTIDHPAGEWMPLFIRLAGQRVLVAGGGVEARRKIDRLLKHGASVDIVAEALVDELLKYREMRRVQWLGSSLPEAAAHYRLLIVAGGSAESRRRALEYGRRNGMLINAVDDPENCSAIVPAIVDRAPITIAIGSGGTAPELARMIRSRIEALLPETLGPLAQIAADLKHAIRQRYPALPRRRQFLDWLFNGAPADALKQGTPETAKRLAERALADSAFEISGSVALVGAGPGDPELLTLKALRLIQQADVIVHDALVDGRVFDYARRDVERFDVSKRGGRKSTPQDEIHDLLKCQARAGKRVVRLKGGDPMIFGRGGEEVEALRKAGIEYQIVPGITAAAGCGAYAGIPLTHRDHAQSVRFVTAHGKDSVDQLDWHALADERQTLAFYMAVARIRQLQDQLIGHGRKPATPVAIVQNGTRPDQVVLSGRLDQLAELARTHRIESPAMIYIGAVAGLADTLGWYGQAPLKIDAWDDSALATG